MVGMTLADPGRLDTCPVTRLGSAANVGHSGDAPAIMVAADPIDTEM
jgi:hypothetical protein